MPCYTARALKRVFQQPVHSPVKVLGTSRDSSVRSEFTNAGSRPEQILQNEDGVSGALGQATHQVGIPFRPKGNVNPAAPAIFHQLLLQVAADAIEHLKLKS